MAWKLCKILAQFPARAASARPPLTACAGKKCLQLQTFRLSRPRVAPAGGCLFARKMSKTLDILPHSRRKAARGGDRGHNCAQLCTVSPSPLAPFHREKHYYQTKLNLYIGRAGGVSPGADHDGGIDGSDWRDAENSRTAYQLHKGVVIP